MTFVKRLRLRKVSLIEVDAASETAHYDQLLCARNSCAAIRSN